MSRMWIVFLLVSTVRGADVRLCMTNLFVVENGVRMAATSQVSRIFDAIGIRLEWEKKGSTRPDGVVVEVRFATGVRAPPGSMAFSTPFDAQPVITVLYDRILSATDNSPEFRRRLLAWVLAHEIGHVLKRTTAHSPDGLMKANWTLGDLARIGKRGLPFVPEDVERIRYGLATLTGKRVQAANGGAAER